MLGLNVSEDTIFLSCIKKPIPLQQSNNFCKDINKNSKPILDDFLTIKENVLCKALPDNNSDTNGDLVVEGRAVHIYGKFGEGS